MTVNDLSARREAREATRITSAHARSWQLVSAMYPETFDAAHLGHADQILLDVEDAIDDSHKAQALENVVDWLRGGGTGWVRINDVTTPFWEQDLAVLAGVPGLSGVMLAKTESAGQVTETFERLGKVTPVIALVESALGIEEANDIARAEGCFRLAFGSGDYRKDTGAANEPIAMAYPRTKLVLASRIGGLTGPIDGPTVGPVSKTTREQSSDAVTLGMTGKLCLDNDQPEAVNRYFTPTPADIEWAKEFLADFEASGRVIRDGSDKPRLARAQKIAERATVYGVATF